MLRPSLLLLSEQGRPPLGPKLLRPLVIERLAGDQWRDQYIQGAALTPPPGPIIGGSVLHANRETRAAFRLAPGRQYYVVIDNTAVAGTVMPQGNPITGGPTAVLSAVVQLGDVD